jgi:hypothetical protein
LRCVFLGFFSICSFFLFSTDLYDRESFIYPQFASLFKFRLISTIANHLFLLNLLILPISHWFRPFINIFFFSIYFLFSFRLISTIANHLYLLNLFRYLGVDWYRASLFIGFLQFAHSSYFPPISTITDHFFLLNLLFYLCVDWFRPSANICFS